MRVLSLDSASETATVAVLEDSRVLGEINFNYKKQHSVLIMDMIDSLLNSLDLDISQIDGFVVSKGPGSFTGLRIGMATIKGLSLGSDKPFVSVSSLDALANNLYGVEGVICPIMDALRGNVYTRIYKSSGDNIAPLTDFITISLDELCARLSEYNCNLYFIGDGTEKHREFIANALKNSHFAPPHLNFIRAASLGDLGSKMIKEGKIDNLNTSAPIYLRKPQAEREYNKKMGIIDNE